MRLERLVLERFGHFSGAELDLSAPEVRLHVVFGPNEAGKSTALQAIGDLLFGIDVRTPYGFRHGYDSLRIGAEIRAADGRTLGFRRRKGAKNTLLDPEDKPLPETALAAFLGGADRRLFEGLFGLNQEGLRAGGQDMLAARGDLGRMLFEAGSHIRGLGAVRGKLEEEAGALFAPRASTRKFNEAFNAYQEARRRVETLAVRADDWERNERALADALADAEALRARRQEIETQRARAERIQRLLPLVADLRHAQAELAVVADAPDMPADSERQYEDATRRIALASDRAKRAEGAAQEARREIASIEVPERVLGLDAETEALHEQRGAIAKDDADLPKRRAERAEAVARLEDLARRLGVARDPDRVLAALPPDTALSELRGLIAEVRRTEIAAREAQARRDDAALDAGRAEKALASVGSPPDATALTLALDLARARIDSEERLGRIARDREAARNRLAASLAALPLWAGEEAALAAASVPVSGTVQRFETAFATAEKALDRAREEKDKIERALADAGRALAALRDQGEIPTAEAVDAARARRDALWEDIRRAWTVGGSVPESGARADLVRAYERAVLDADALADRRESEASRVERHAHLTAERKVLEERRGAAAEALETAESAMRALSAEWKAAWDSLSFDPLPPREMAAWLTERVRILQEAESAAALAREEAYLGAMVEEAKSALRTALAGFLPGEPIESGLALLARRAEPVLAGAVRAARARDELTATRQERLAALAREECHLERAKAERAALADRWQSALARAGLPTETAPDPAEKALDLWQEVRLVAAGLESLDHRIRRMEEDRAAFAEEAHRIAREAAPDLEGEEPAEAARRMHQRLQAAHEAERRRADIAARLSRAEQDIQRARAEEAEACAALDLLRRHAGCVTDEDIADAIRRAETKAGLIRQIAQAEARIRQSADGLPLAQALAETESARSDEIRAEIARISEETDALLQKSQEIGKRLEAAEQAKTEMEQGRGAAAAAQDMQDAVTALEDCARRWMVLKTATFLLGQGIERFRKEQQGPLLERAGELFALLTRGSFSGFKLDYDLKDTPILIGVRADGATCPIEGMSEGTRDQLFLALRLAAVELYVSSAEPLPFVADDLFVNFDDARTEAGLEALMTLGASTQVLLFTHHAHIAELARRKGGNAGVTVLPLVA